MRDKAPLPDMFKKTNPSEATLFDSPSNMLRGRRLKAYEDPKEWHNQFYELVTSNIDEDVFRPLFKDSGMGRGNASISQLVAIMILKEGNRKNDEEMFYDVDFNMLTRKALGLVNITDEAPCMDTYYLLRRRIVNYEDETGVNLLEHCFKDVTKAQAVKFHVKGESIRMDSKLIGSNIARYSRYRIILTTLQKWAEGGLSQLNPSLRKKVLPYLEEDAQKTEYRSTSEEIEQRLKDVGALIYKILVRIKAGDDLLLSRVFNEQYEVSHGTVTPRDKKKISADSVQNPNDPDAAYRGKGDQKVKGYSVNATETNDEDGAPSLITDVQVKPATAADNGYLQDSVEGSQEVTGTRVNHINADGAYQSPDNRDFAKDNDIDLVTTGLQGKASRYDLSLDGEELTVVDKKTGEKIPVTRVGEKWRIATGGKSKYRYFTVRQIESSMLRKRLGSIPMQELNRRNNVEAAMFQISYHTRNNKTRYRGLSKHVMWACARCLWINFRRLAIFQAKSGKSAFSALLRLLRRLWKRILALCGEFEETFPIGQIIRKPLPRMTWDQRIALIA